ncbi:hypothetical protein ILUMI_09516 [Ignelater luminosus]|uniref:Uncharacterized protein n=1 Tax=Ignelater luminosus TaxID=2038154 RepID=A0A8K0D284_IGNLU|nr:hypothetical protein ILUMI_09516 [Ignelater luminosus]
MPIGTSNESESDSKRTENRDDIVATTNGNNGKWSVLNWTKGNQIIDNHDETEKQGDVLNNETENGDKNKENTRIQTTCTSDRKKNFRLKKNHTKEPEGENIDELVYNEHLKRKVAARDEKMKDKEEEKFVFTMDLQSVLMASLTHVSAMYYKSEGALTANEFASLLYTIVSNLVTEPGDEVVTGDV